MSFRGTFTCEYLYCDKCEAAFAEVMEWAVKYRNNGILSGFFKDSNHNEGIYIFLRELNEIPLCEGHTINVAVFWESDRFRLVRVGRMTCEEINVPQSADCVGHPR
jgi:hypothetical protein